MGILRTCIFVAAAWALSMPCLAQERPVTISSWQEVEAHTIGSAPIVQLDWVGGTDLRRQVQIEMWRALLVVNESGAVEDVQIANGPDPHREEALAALRGIRFVPFERDGHAVHAQVPFTIQGRARDYSGPSDRSFPTEIDLRDVHIRLARNACYGSCPTYTLEIDGSGNVSYRAEANTLIAGEHHWTIAQDRVRAILAQFRRADYFRLDGYYALPVTDVPAFITGLEIGSRKKFVFDYGRVMGGAMAATSFGRASGFLPAPQTVGDVEDAIDELSGAQAFLTGTSETISNLRAEHFDFRSPEAATAVRFLIARCNVPVARAFLVEGASADAAGESSIFVSATRCRDLPFLRDLIAAGALTKPGAADSFLDESAATASPELVSEALRHSRAVNRSDQNGRTTLFYAASANEPTGGEPPARFDRAATISLLLAAGADARRIDRQGNSVLHNVRDGRSARALLGAGSNPSAINARGQTALFSQSSGEVVQALIQAHVDPNVRDTYGQTALYSANSGEAARALVAGGASLTIVDAEGHTPLEGCNNEDVAVALIELGSPIPTGASFDRLMARASPYWQRLMAALRAHASHVP